MTKFTENVEQLTAEIPNNLFSRMIIKYGGNYLRVWDLLIRLTGVVCVYSGLYYGYLSIAFNAEQLKHIIVLLTTLLFLVDIPRTRIFARKKSSLIANFLNKIKGRKPLKDIDAQELWHEATNLPFNIARNLFGCYLDLIFPCVLWVLFYEKMPYIEGINVFVAGFLAITCSQLFYFFSWEIVLRPVLRLIQATGESIDIGAEQVHKINFARKLKLGFISVTCISLLLVGTLGYYKLKEAIAAVGQGINPELIIASFTTQSVLIALITLSLVVVLSLLLSRSVSAPIQVLNKGIKEVTKGNLNTQIDILSNDELGHLAQVFNDMIVRLRESTDHIKQQNVKLKELDRLKSEFLANTSHELRTPINGIIGLVESILDGADGPITGRVQHHLRMINECGKSLKNLVDNLLDLTKIMVGQAEFRLKRLNLKSLLNLILPLGEGLIRDKDVSLIAEVDENLPEVYADQNKIWQVLINLLGNAVKFTQRGEIKIGARLLEDESEGNGRQALVYVSDTGIGIRPEDQQVIFEEFRQLDGSAAREYGGTGLGLSIAKKILAKHNCDIWVESMPDKGSTFYFTLPTEAEQIDESRLVQADADQPVTVVNGLKPELELESSIGDKRYGLKKEEKYERIVRGQSELILVIDDNPVNIEVVRTRLELNNYKVLALNDSQEGLKLALSQKDNIDLIILDLMMPRMSGYEFCQQLRKYSPDVPIIMLTAKGSTEDLIYGLNLGANDYIAKPFNKEELVARVSALLRLGHLQKELKRSNYKLADLNKSLEEKVRRRTNALMSANKELRQLDLKKSEFLSVVSHELRTPLTSIKAFTEILMGGENTNDYTTGKYLKIINDESDRLTRLITALLSLSRLQLGKETFNFQQVNVARTLNMAIDSVTPLLKAKHLNIREYIPGDIPPIYCDQDKLMQVMNNLLGNAIKFSKPKGNILVDLRAIKDTKGKDKEIEISVADEGEGIAPEYLDKIFSKFKQPGALPPGVPQGTGLGLAISKEIISRLGGCLWVESTPGKGSKFYFSLPVESKPTKPKNQAVYSP